MSKYTPTKKQKTELSSLRKKARDKQYRLKKRYGIVATKPPTKRTFASKNEYRDELKSLKAYLKTTDYKPVKIGEPGTEFYITQKEYREAKEKLKSYGEKREDFFGGIETQRIFSGGERQSETVREYAERIGTKWNNIYYTMLNPQTFEPDTFASKEQFDSWMKRLQYQNMPEYWENKRQTMYDNFLNSIRILSERNGIDVSQLIASIESLGVSDFIDLYYRASDDLSAVYFNTPDKLDDLRVLNEILTNVQNDINSFIAEKSV